METMMDYRHLAILSSCQCKQAASQWHCCCSNLSGLDSTDCCFRGLCATGRADAVCTACSFPPHKTARRNYNVLVTKLLEHNGDMPAHQRRRFALSMLPACYSVTSHCDEKTSRRAAYFINPDKLV
eukprot:GHUV01001612.1.p2 GENE.GHUV01001612.1~~GHUV01001612.1.p2  ORF type:complete len:126 (-),score=14.43 GHUV01001612.1:618-995(-)